MWSSTNQINKTYIDEANKHLQALTDQHNQLEAKLKEANEKLIAKDIETKEIIQDMARRHQENTREMSDKVNKLDSRCRKLEMQLESKELELSIAEQRSRLMEEIIKYKPLLAKLTISLEQAEQLARSGSNQRQYYTTQGGSAGFGNTQGHSTDMSTLVEKAAMSLPIYDCHQNGTK